MEFLSSPFQLISLSSFASLLPAGFLSIYSMDLYTEVRKKINYQGRNPSSTLEVFSYPHIKAVGCAKNEKEQEDLKGILHEVSVIFNALFSPLDY